MGEVVQMKGKDAMGKVMTGRCYTSHPPLKIGEHVIYGGSCIEPVIGDADVYVGLDHGMKMTKRYYPWRDGTEVKFLIQDMGVPENADDFKDLIAWLSTQLAAGKKVHVGCIGGHGRTGMVLSALVKVMTGNEDATTYVRENYCQKAVESQRQVDWLNKHFGIKPVSPAKGFSSDFTSGSTPRQRSFDDYDRAGRGSSSSGTQYGQWLSKYRDTKKPERVGKGKTDGKKVSPVKSARNIW